MNNATPEPGPREPSLPDSELEVMRVLWELHGATAREVWGVLQSRGSQWTYATVNTLLQRLVAKGLAVSDQTQMSYRYSPAVSREDVISRRVSHLVDKLYNGQGGMLVMHLLQTQNLSPDEVDQIRRLLNDGDAGLPHS